MIRNIDGKDVNKITSGQVIIDLKSIVKELIENSIDAKSSTIEITFNNNGIDEISSQDNGKGISPEDFPSVCLRNHTSKLSKFEDLQSLTSLGFRGEALNSICSLSNNFKITTICQSDEDFNKIYTLNYDSMGNLVKLSHKLTKQSSGTLVNISKLFYNLPVRYKNFVKNSRREFHKAVNFIINYMLIFPNIKFTVINIVNNKKNVLLNSKGGDNASVLDNMISIFGNDGAKDLTAIDIEINKDISIKGHISKYSLGYSGRSSSDRQFLFINKRPVVLKKISRTINECYKQFNHLQYPVFILNLQINPNILDINLTPDKTRILIHNEDEVIEQLRVSLTEYLDSQNDINIPKSSMKLEKDFASDSRNSPLLYNNRELPPTSSSEYSELKISSQTLQDKHKKRTRYYDNDKHEILGNEEQETVTQAEAELNNRMETQVSSVKPKTIPSKEQKTFEVQSVELHDDSSELFVQETDIEPAAIEEKFVSNTAKIIAPESQQNQSDANVIQNRMEEEQAHNSKAIKNFESATNDVIHSTKVTPVNSTPLCSDRQCIDFGPSCKHFESSSLGIEETEIDKEGETAIGCENKPRTVNVKDILKSRVPVRPDIRKLVASYRNYNEEGNSFNHEDNYGKNFHPAEDEELKVEIGNQEWWQPSQKRLKRNQLHNIRSELNIDKTQFRPLIRMKKVEGKNSEIKFDDISKSKDQEAKLSYTIHKSDFLKMKIIGQFNLGFILVLLNKDEHNNLFIIDQHASDEKYNFERLVKNFEINYQSLVQPKIVELSIIEEILVIDNQEIFERNGFRFEVDMEQESGRRIKLIAIPNLKGHTFNLQDFNELINLVNDNGNNKDIKCLKIRSLCAMKACRSLIMIGQSLTRSKMEQVVGNLSKLNKPWNCPHGRPTMRHIIELDNWKVNNYEDYNI